jgi:Phosphatidylinositol 3- and 4-kinase
VMPCLWQSLTLVVATCERHNNCFFWAVRSEMGASRFSVRDVQRIGILDVRLYNTDRHAGNILVRRPRSASSGNLTALARLDEGQLELRPIDHGFCLPEALEAAYFEWLHWPQVSAVHLWCNFRQRLPASSP